MSRGVYYNEIEPYPAQWLRNLIKRGLIPGGEVDERSIVDVQPDDVRGFRQCHWFAGMGGWPLALDLAGWPDDREVWTGSCPCQPFSVAGMGKGGADDRHLAPSWLRLIRDRRPATLFGEQVRNAVAHGWIDALFAELERDRYACGAVLAPAAGVGAPHIRDRVWFVANADRDPLRVDEQRRSRGRPGGISDEGNAEPRHDGSAGDVADADGARREAAKDAGTDRGGQGERETAIGGRPAGFLEPERGGADMADADGRGFEGVRVAEHPAQQGARGNEPDGRSAPGRRQGSDAPDAGEPRLSAPEFHPFFRTGRRDKRRAAAECGWWSTEPDVGRVAYGISGRVGQLRALGNAIVPQVAAQVISAFLECRP
jgi:DNA (cytosine-5)-methyltransferase 1